MNSTYPAPIVPVDDPNNVPCPGCPAEKVRLQEDKTNAALRGEAALARLRQVQSDARVQQGIWTNRCHDDPAACQCAIKISKIMTDLNFLDEQESQWNSQNSFTQTAIDAINCAAPDCQTKLNAAAYKVQQIKQFADLIRDNAVVFEWRYNDWSTTCGGS